MATWSDAESPAWQWVAPRPIVWPEDSTDAGYVIVTAALVAALAAAMWHTVTGSGWWLLAVCVALGVAIARAQHDHGVIR